MAAAVAPSGAAAIRGTARCHIVHPTHTPPSLIDGAIDVLCQHWGGDRTERLDTLRKMTGSDRKLPTAVIVTLPAAVFNALPEVKDAEVVVADKDPLAPVAAPNAKLTAMLAASTAAAAAATTPSVDTVAATPVTRSWTPAKKKIQPLICGAPEPGVDIGLPSPSDEHLPSRITVGHAQLQVAADHADGEACIVYSVVVHIRCRRLGMGRIIMDALDRIARLADYSYIYLFTNNQQSFYESCGYSVCTPISFLGASAKRISMEQLESLEAMIGQRVASLGLEKQSYIGSAATLTQTWLRKRLREEKPSVYITDVESIDENERTFHRIPDRLSSPYLYYAYNVPSHQQIGPSCGLGLLRITRDYLNRDGKTVAPAPQTLTYGATDTNASPLVQSPMDESSAVSLIHTLQPGVLTSAPVFVDATDKKTSGDVSDCSTLSLLETAIEAGYTTDGEMFDINEYAALTRTCLRTPAQVVDMSSDAVIAALLNKCLVMIAYDRDTDHYPCAMGGLRAHWLVVHGFFMALPPSPSSSSSSTSGSAGTPSPPSPPSANASLYLLCRHTLAARSLIVPYALLRRSNANLTTAHPRFTLKKAPNLKGKMVIVQMVAPSPAVASPSTPPSS